MTIGVIITVFNLEKFVEEAIRSVLNQSRKADRIIVINDGSSDNSMNVIKQFADQVEIIDQAVNRGVLPSLISGIKKMDTDVIAFLDGDDRWAGEKLKRIAAVFEANERCMLVTHSYRRILADGQPDPTIDKTLKNLDRIERLKGSVLDSDRELKNSILSYKGVWLGSAFSIRKNCLQISEFESWSLDIWGHELSHQDQPLAAFMIWQNPQMTIHYVAEKLFDYRVFGDNSSGSSSTHKKATHTLKRSKATLLRTHDLVKRMSNREEELTRQQNKLSEIDYLESLYAGNLKLAGKIFFSLFFSFWNVRESIKEGMRFFGVIFLGVDRVLKYK